MKKFNFIKKIDKNPKFGTILEAGIKNYMIYKKHYILPLIIFVHLLGHSQEDKDYRYKKTDTTEYIYTLIEGDTLYRQYINLDEVLLLNKLKFDSEEDRRNYLILRRRTRKVYPYAKLAAERLTIMNERLSKLEKKNQKRKYTKQIQKYIEEEFTAELKNLTRSEGRILVKLIYRQTGNTVFELVKEHKTGWRAFRYNTTASLFDISLKSTYSPIDSKEDFLIEDILQRAFQEGALKSQPSRYIIDYFEAAEKWKI